MMNTRLLQKYSTRAPRYTSYPPANYFHGGIGEKEYREGIKESNRFGTPNISLYFHIPFCHKRCYYCGCNAMGIRSGDYIENYVSALLAELELLAGHLDDHRKVSQVHFGGGTPNVLSGDQFSRIMEAVEKHFTYIDRPERAIECNPAYLDFDYLDMLIKNGFNRFSLGIQDFNTDVLSAVNRDASRLPVHDLVNHIRMTGTGASVNLDFIYGLPRQDPQGFLRTIDQAIDIRPDRLVTFSYAHMPSMFKGQQVLEKIGLPSAGIKAEMFSGAHEKLTSNGYVTIGLDHYALETDELSVALRERSLHRNFQGYCTRNTTGQVYALGISGIAQLEGMYAQNTKNTEKYIQTLATGKFAIDKGYRLTEEERIIRACITGFMCNRELVFSEIANRMQVAEDRVKESLNLDPEQLNGFVDDGLLDWNEYGITLQPDGILFIRNVAAALDPLMKESQQSYSTSV